MLTRHIQILRDTCRDVRQKHPFDIEAMVVLPEHLHCLWRLPEGDTNFPLRWRLIKADFSRRIEFTERISDSAKAQG
ncbi:MAG: hypothetical protein RQ715_01340 [Methylococcales bacterium]|nr:hypothetical protein [Methylococcales bacterium]